MNHNRQISEALSLQIPFFFFQVVFISFLFLPPNFLLSFTVPDGLIFISPGVQNGTRHAQPSPSLHPVSHVSLPVLVLLVP